MRRDKVNAAKGKKRRKTLLFYHPQVEVVRTTDNVLIASLRGIEFCRLAYSHNNLLFAVYENLKREMLSEQVEALMKGRPDTPDERSKAEEWSLELFNHHAAGVATYLSENLELMLGSMLETYMNIGGLYAKQDKDRQLENKFTRVTSPQIEEIFSDLATRILKEQAGATAGRPVAVTDQQIEVAIRELPANTPQRKIAERFGVHVDTIKNWRRNKGFKSYREAKAAVRGGEQSG